MWSSDLTSRFRLGPWLRSSGHPATAVLALVMLLLTTGCSVRRVAIKNVADMMSGGAAGVFTSDDDPELVREALPFALKTTEMLLAEVPDHRGLLLSACQGFTQYSYAFVELDALRIEPEDYRASKRLEERALKLYLRARDYCFRALELSAPGLEERLRSSPETAFTGEDFADVDLLFWTAASWGAAISLGLDRPALVADLPAVRALLERALEIDPSYSHGALHDAMVVLEALPEHMGGSLERAREHFERSLELSRGRLAGPYLTWAGQVSVQQQDREGFERNLNKALEIEADAFEETRLANLIAQERARILLSRVDDLILDDLDSESALIEDR